MVLLRLFAPLALLLKAGVFWASWGISCTLPVKACPRFFGELYVQRPRDPSANGCKEMLFIIQVKEHHKALETTLHLGIKLQESSDVK